MVEQISLKSTGIRFFGIMFSFSFSCRYQALLPRPYRLFITIIIQDYPGSSRQTLRCSLIVDPRECGCAHNPPRCVPTPPCTKDKPAKGLPSHNWRLGSLQLYNKLIFKFLSHIGCSNSGTPNTESTRSTRVRAMVVASLFGIAARIKKRVRWSITNKTHLQPCETVLYSTRSLATR